MFGSLYPRVNIDVYNKQTKERLGSKMKTVIFNVVMLVVFVALGLNCSGAVPMSGRQIDPKQDYINKAYEYDKNKDYEKVIETTTAALELQPDDSDWRTYVLRGWANKVLNNYEMAISDYCNAIGLGKELPADSKYKPNNETIAAMRNTVALVYLEYARTFTRTDGTIVDLANYDSTTARAIGFASLAIKLDPKKALYYETRGRACLSRNDAKRAMDNFSKALELNPDSEVARKFLMGINEHQKEYQKLEQPTDLIDF